MKAAKVSEPESSPRSISKAEKNVKQKTGLNKSILTKGMGRIPPATGVRDTLGWRHAYPGSTERNIPCPRAGCGHVCKENRKRQAQFPSVKCGFSENADLVSAVNILREGHAQSACQVNGEVSSHQQEPPSIAA